MIDFSKFASLSPIRWCHLMCFVCCCFRARELAPHSSNSPSPALLKVPRRACALRVRPSFARWARSSGRAPDQRKQILQRAVKAAPAPAVLSQHFAARGQVLSAVCEHDLEAVVAKRADGGYGQDWFKIRKPTLLAIRRPAGIAMAPWRHLRKADLGDGRRASVSRTTFLCEVARRFLSTFDPQI
jgi:hypothetical protein